MASSRVHETRFLFNAALNSGFSSAFTKAQQEFTRLGKEIQGVHRIQGDISTYQKQQAAIAATTAKLENLQKQHDLLQKEIGETNGSTAALEREKLKLEQQIKNTSVALENQQNKFAATSARLQEAEINTKDLTGASAELTRQLSELQAQQEEASKGAMTFGEEASRGVSAVGEALAAAGIAAAMKEIAGAYMEYVSVAADFEESMSNVEALSGASVLEMDALNAKAKELGATTKFTAQEAGDAMGYMSMAGWNAQEMLSGMNGVIQLAAASGEDLATVSDIVTDSLSAFKLTAADSAHFSDVLAQAATKSNTNVALMGDSFRYAASLCGTLGYSIEDAAVNLGIMANNGIKGSQAGTALKTSLANLSAPTDDQAIMMERLGISMTDTGGAMLSLSELTGRIRAAFSGLSEAQQAEAASTLFGKEAMTGMLAIINTSQSEYDSLTASIQNSAGAAERMAAIKLDNLNGQLTLMDSAMDALKTTIGEEFNPELRTLAEAGTDVLAWANNFVQENPALVKGIMAGAGAVGVGAAALTGFVGVTKVLIPLMGKLTVASAAASAAIPGVNIILGVTAAVAGIVGVATALTTAIDDGVPSVKELTEAAQDMGAALDEAQADYEQTATQTMATAEAAGIYIDKLREIEAAEGNAASSSQEYHNILALLSRTVPELADYINLETNSIEGGAAALEKHTEAWKKNAEAQAYQEYLNSLYDKYGTVMTEAAESSIKLTQAKTNLETIEKKHATAVKRINELEAESIKNGTELPQEYYTLQKSLHGYIDEVSTAQKEVEVYTAAVNDDAEAIASAEAEIKNAEESVEQLTSVTREYAEAAAYVAQQEQALQSVVGSVTEQMESLAKEYEEAYKAAYESIHGQYAIWDEAAEAIPTKVADLNAALESQATYWQNYNADLQTLLDHSDELDGLNEMVASFADGSQASVNMVAGLADAINEGDLASVQEAIASWEKLQEQQAATSDALAQEIIDYPNKFAELQAEMHEGVEGMSMPEEAEASARDTIQAFIDEADKMLPVVQRAYAQLGRAAADALGLNLAKARKIGGGAVPITALDVTGAYASGTPDAPPGWAWVGEEGPELMRMRGGEAVLPTRLSQEVADIYNEYATYNSYAAATPAVSTAAEPEVVEAVASPSSGDIIINVTVSPTYQINGGTVPADLREQLERHDANLKELILDTMQEAAVNFRRGSIR